MILDYKNYSEIQDIQEANHFFVLYFVINVYTNVITRTYDKLQDVLSKIGGFTSTLFSICAYLSMAIAHNKFNIINLLQYLKVLIVYIIDNKLSFKNIKIIFTIKSFNSYLIYLI